MFSSSSRVHSTETKLSYAITTKKPVSLIYNSRSFNLLPWPVNAPTINSLRRTTVAETSKSATRLVNSSVSQNREAK